MATTINASTSAGLVNTADTSGVLQLQTAGTTAVTISTAQVATFAQAPVLPAASIPQAALAAGVAGNGPAFSAYGTAFQSVASSTFAKIAFNTEDFDTNSNYDNVTNYRFTPTVAGYYQINATISAGTSVTGAVQVAVYKNGSIYSYGTNVPNSNLGPNANVSVVLYCNGSTDYVEIYGYQTSGGSINLGSGNSTYKFSGAMVRGA